MSKSATEQFQIKKKRKHNSSNNNNCKIQRYSDNNNNNNNNNKAREKVQQQQQQQQRQRYANNKLDENYCDDAFVFLVDSGIRDHKQATKGIVQQRQEQQHQQQQVHQRVLHKSHARMPLSQGHCIKGALAAKRAGLKSPKISEPTKRRPSENNHSHNHQHHQHQQHHYPHFHHLASNSGSSYSNIFSSLPTTATPPLSSRHHRYNGVSSTAALSATPGTPLQQQLCANNQITYLWLGESFARCGRLREAFDMYELIASEQRDGFIPLDRLGTLASNLILYIRQLATNESQSHQSEVAAELWTAQQVPSSQSAGKVESTLRARYPARHDASMWQLTSANTRLPQLRETISDVRLLDLHAPTRELRIPSPTQSEDYDPLLCPLCRDVLRCPVTTNCGHTFCRQCCETITMCNICHIKFPKTAADMGKSAYDLHTAAANATTTSSGSYFNRLSNGNSRNPSEPVSLTPHMLAAASVASSSSSSTMATTFSSMRTSPLLSATQLVGRTVPLTSALAAVTTTTVASTTATATTTMASTSAAAVSSVGAASAVATIRGVAAGGGGARAADNMKFMPDVLVRRLVEKWWGADLQAKKINETAASYMHLNLLDDALKFCNASLEKSPSNFKSLCLRAEVLLKLNHYQSSLADVENALKARYTSAKAHYLRALSLSELGRLDEALYDDFLAISLDNSTNLSSSELFQHDLAKILQKLLAQTPKSKPEPHRTHYAKAPYTIHSEHRQRRKKIALLSNANGDHLSSYDDEFLSACGGKPQYDIMSVDDEEEEDSLLAGALYDVDNRSLYEMRSGKVFEHELRCHATRKHFRRKWMTKETELLPATGGQSRRCSSLFGSLVDRTQLELQRIKKLESTADASHKQHTSVPVSLIDASDFDCVLCCRTLWKPVVTPCGHTYCLVCLDRCMDYNSPCPLCMSPLVELNVSNIYQGSSSPVPFALAKRPVTKFLEAAMKRFIPDIYEKRFRQEIDMEPSVPVFICTTAFPYVPCPLFVCEPRYRLMVRRAVESGEKTFGIVQPHNGKARYFDVGTILDIRDCVLLGDGCSILSTIGCKRFKILARNEKDGYETAKVEYIYDEAISDENVKFVSNMHASVLSKAIEWFDSLSTEQKQEILQSFGEMPPVEDNWEIIADGPAWAWWIIALLPLSQQLKVDILATTSLEKRLRAIEKTLDCLSGSFRNRPQQNCSVVGVQQQQHQQHQQQQQRQQHECDEDELTHTDECCQRTTHSGNSETHPTSPEQLLL